jgi:hypothetical protein
MLDAIESSGTAMWPGVTPAPLAARVSQAENAGIASTGNGGSGPRLSSKTDVSGLSQE